MSVAREVRIELPFPPAGLNPNRKSHYMVKAKIVRDYRADCGWCAKGARAGMGSFLLDEKDRRRWTDWPLEPPVSARVTFVVPTRHKRDTDNLLAMLKPAWDGLTDAGVLEGDDAERLHIEVNPVLAYDKGRSGVIVELSSRG